MNRKEGIPPWQTNFIYIISDITLLVFICDKSYFYDNNPLLPGKLGYFSSFTIWIQLWFHESRTSSELLKKAGISLKPLCSLTS